jgi:hypothetical protein
LPALNPDFLYAALDATAYAAFVKESRKRCAGATKLHRKSGEARNQSRDSSQSAKALLPRINAGAPTTESALSRSSPQDQQTESNFDQAISGSLRYFCLGPE